MTWERQGSGRRRPRPLTRWRMSCDEPAVSLACPNSFARAVPGCCSTPFCPGAGAVRAGRQCGELGVDLGAVDAVVISQLHPDHAGGIGAARRRTSGSPASRWSRAGCRRTRPLRCRPACRRDPDHRPDRDRAGHGGAAATAAHAVLAGYITEQALVVTSAASGWFYERVRSRDPRTAWLQHRADRIWAAPKRGLPPDQDTEAAITATGFRIQARRRFDFQPCLIAAPAGPPILGRAIRE